MRLPPPPVSEPPLILSSPPPAPAVGSPAPGLPDTAEIVLLIPDRGAFDANRLAEQLSLALAQATPVRIEISVHTNAEGERADNLELSQRWAGALRDRLISQGFAAGTVSAVGYGEDMPAADDPDAIENQRIVVFIRYE